jgi:hypothetical protein
MSRAFGGRPNGARPTGNSVKLRRERAIKTAPAMRRAEEGMAALGL